MRSPSPRASLSFCGTAPLRGAATRPVRHLLQSAIGRFQSQAGLSVAQMELGALEVEVQIARLALPGIDDDLLVGFPWDEGLLQVIQIAQEDLDHLPQESHALEHDGMVILDGQRISVTSLG